MGAQPKLLSGVAPLVRQDLPSCAAVMLTCAVCSLLRASCLFSPSHTPTAVHDYRGGSAPKALVYFPARDR